MPNNLRWKWIAINAIVLGCVLAITGVPKSNHELMANLAERVRLGLKWTPMSRPFLGRNKLMLGGVLA